MKGPGKSIVGEAVFMHESGIHADGLLKDRRKHESFPPEELGCTHGLVLGQHSGSRGAFAACTKLGLPLDDAPGAGGTAAAAPMVFCGPGSSPGSGRGGARACACRTRRSRAAYRSS